MRRPAHERLDAERPSLLHRSQRAWNRQAEAAARESELRFQTVVDAVPDLIFIKDSHGRFVTCNRAMASALGAEGTESLIGRTAAAIRCLPTFA